MKLWSNLLNSHGWKEGLNLKSNVAFCFCRLVSDPGAVWWFVDVPYLTVSGRIWDCIFGTLACNDGQSLWRQRSKICYYEHMFFKWKTTCDVYQINWRSYLVYFFGVFVLYILRFSIVYDMVVIVFGWCCIMIPFCKRYLHRQWCGHHTGTWGATGVWLGPINSLPYTRILCFTYLDDLITLHMICIHTRRLIVSVVERNLLNISV